MARPKVANAPFKLMLPGLARKVRKASITSFGTLLALRLYSRKAGRRNDSGWNANSAARCPIMMRYSDSGVIPFAREAATRLPTLTPT
jgi:hypothetical protein